MNCMSCPWGWFWGVVDVLGDDVVNDCWHVMFHWPSLGMGKKRNSPHPYKINEMVPFVAPFFHHLTELGNSYRLDIHLFAFLSSRRISMTVDENWELPLEGGWPEGNHSETWISLLSLSNGPPSICFVSFPPARFSKQTSLPPPHLNLMLNLWWVK